jgi:hypothetical protein
MITKRSVALKYVKMLKLKKTCKIYTVKPVLTTTSEQRPAVYKGQLKPQFSKTDSNFVGINCE